MNWIRDLALFSPLLSLMGLPLLNKKSLFIVTLLCKEYLCYQLHSVLQDHCEHRLRASQSTCTRERSLSLSHYVQLFATPWTAARQACMSFTISQSLLKLMSIESVMPSNHLILYHPLLLLPSIFPRVFSSELALPIRWPKYWSFNFSLSPSDEYSGLISFKTDWFDLLAVQGTLRSLLQHHSSKASVEISITGIPQRAWGDYSVTGDMVCSLQHVESGVGRGLIGRASQWRIVSAVWYRGGTNWAWGQVVRKRSKEVGFGTILKNR